MDGARDQKEKSFQSVTPHDVEYAEQGQQEKIALPAIDEKHTTSRSKEKE